MIKQVIVIRKDLHMRLGKSCSQASHASMKVILDQMNYQKHPREDEIRMYMDLDFNSPLYLWLNGLFTKIVVGVDSEIELLKIYTIAKASGIICSLIEDAGLTEFNGIPTKTCCAIGPAEEEKIDKVTGHLKLL